MILNQETFDKIGKLFADRYDIASYCGVRCDGAVIFRMFGRAKTIGLIAYISQDFEIIETKDIEISYYQGRGKEFRHERIRR